MEKAVNLLPVMRTFKRQIPAWGSWFFTTDIRPIAGFASAHRLMLMGFFHTAVSKSRIAFLVTTEQEALEELARTRPGLLFVVDQLEQGSSLALVEQARSVVPDIRTIMIVNGQKGDLVSAGLSSADAVLSESDCFEPEAPMVTLFRMISLGQRYRSRSVKAAMAAANEQGEAWRDGPPGLTPRELEIVALMVEGLSDRQIAEQLGVGYEAARSYGKNLRRKLGAANRAQAVAKLLKLGLTGLRR